MTRIDFSSLPSVKRAFPSVGNGLGEPVDPSEESRRARERQEALRAREERDRAERLRAFLTSRGKRYEGCTLDNFEVRTPEQGKVVESLRSYGARMTAEVAAGRGVVLFGGVGSGKDHLVVALSRVAILDHGLSVVWKNGLELFADFRRVVAGDLAESKVFADLTRPDVLALSDPIPPSGPATEFQAAMMLRAIEARYNAMRPVWVTMNVRSSAEADQRLGAPIVDRLRDGAVCCFCSWPSYRAAQPAGESSGEVSSDG
jgi:DNA replication protein DnaC